MFKLLFLVVLFLNSAYAEQVCADGYTMVNNKCWMFVNQNLERNDAEQGCRFSGGAVMVLTKNSIDNRALVNFLQISGVTSVWLGLFCSFGGGGGCQWNDLDSLSGYNNFLNGTPNLSVGECVVFNTASGQWTSQSCDIQQPYVCELAPTNKDCNDHCDLNFQNFCYTHVTDAKSFIDAQDYCQGINANLASSTNYLEFRFLAQLLRNPGWYWQGGFVPAQDRFFPLDCSSDQMYFSKTIVDGNCMQLRVDDSGLGQDSRGKNCSDQTPFVCKRPASC